MGKKHNESLTLGELPVDCLAKVLEFIEPKDVCRLSAVSRSFNAAGNADSVWEKMLPSHYRDLLARALNRPHYNCMKELYLELCNHVSFGGETKKFWLDKATGKLCFMLSARELGIVWGSDDRYWNWNSEDNVSIVFEEVAELIDVCWFEVEGNFDSTLLSPGIDYTFSFRLKFKESADGPYGWDNKPVEFLFTNPWEQQQQSARFLQNTENPVDSEGYDMTSFRHAGDGWMEFDAGVFVVQENEDGPKKVAFKMKEVVGGDWKDGLLIEGVIIQPSFLVPGFSKKG